GGAHEGAAGQILLVARLLAHEGQAGVGRAVAEHGLGGAAPEVAGLAGGGLLGQRPELVPWTHAVDLPHATTRSERPRPGPARSVSPPQDRGWPAGSPSGGAAGADDVEGAAGAEPVDLLGR